MACYGNVSVREKEVTVVTGRTERSGDPCFGVYPGLRSRIWRLTIHKAARSALFGGFRQTASTGAANT